MQQPWRHGYRPAAAGIHDFLQAAAAAGKRLHVYLSTGGNDDMSKRAADEGSDEEVQQLTQRRLVKPKLMHPLPSTNRTRILKAIEQLQQQALTEKTLQDIKKLQKQLDELMVTPQTRILQRITKLKQQTQTAETRQKIQKLETQLGNKFVF